MRAGEAGFERHGSVGRSVADNDCASSASSPSPSLVARARGVATPAPAQVRLLVWQERPPNAKTGSVERIDRDAGSPSSPRRNGLSKLPAASRSSLDPLPNRSRKSLPRTSTCSPKSRRPRGMFGLTMHGCSRRTQNTAPRPWIALRSQPKHSGPTTAFPDARQWIIHRTPVGGIRRPPEHNGTCASLPLLALWAKNLACVAESALLRYKPA